MSKKIRLTLEQCKQRYPEAWQDANGRKDVRVKGKIELAMVHMINEGESWADAKLKALCIALPPDHFEQVPAAGAWPKLLYHEGGGMKTVENEEEYAAVMKQQKGWSEKPAAKHLDKLQRGATPRDENIKRLQRELDTELKKKEEEKPSETVAA
jgi:hypothetical protein